LIVECASVQTYLLYNFKNKARFSTTLKTTCLLHRSNSVQAGPWQFGKMSTETTKENGMTRFFNKMPLKFSSTALIPEVL